MKDEKRRVDTGIGENEVMEREENKWEENKRRGWKIKEIRKSENRNKRRDG